MTAEIETTAPMAAEIDALAEGLQRQREALATAFDAATEELRQAIEQRLGAERERDRRLRSIQAANVYVAAINARIKQESVASSLRISDSLAEAGVEPDVCFRKMKDLDQLLAESARVVRFITTVSEDIAPAAEELLLYTREQENLAEASQCDALWRQREFERGLKLAPVAAYEAEIVIDDSRSVTHEIKRRAGEARQRAAAIRQSIDHLEKRRRSA